jgi:hypothetical protein
MKKFKNRDGQPLDIPEGFSFTVLFFGVFVPLTRGDVFGFFIMFFLAIISSGFSWLIFPFFYNSMYESFMRKKGYSEESNHTYVSNFKPYYIVIIHNDIIYLVRMKHDRKGSMTFDDLLENKLKMYPYIPEYSKDPDEIVNTLNSKYDKVRTFNDRSSAESFIEDLEKK